MRHITLEFVQKKLGTEPRVDMRPMPMPGKKWPTRVAWSIELHTRIPEPGTESMPAHWKTLPSKFYTYVGKPNRYRALQLQKVLQGLSSNRWITGFIAEFDKGGVVAEKIFLPGEKPVRRVHSTFFAYHPHSADGDIIGGFARPVHLKYIGGMRLYSEKKKLAQEAVDAYYQWYYKQFKRKLRRPKAIPTAVVGGETVEPETEV